MIEQEVDRMPLANGTYTITRRETGEHRTFRIRTQKEDADFAAGERVVSLLTGPDNTRDFDGFGFVNEAGTQINVWRSKRGEDGGKHSAFEYYAAMLVDLANGGKRWGANYDFLESRSCVRCNRKLTDPISIEMGIGPTCRGRD